MTRNKLISFIERICEPKNAVALGVAGALVLSASLADASFFPSADQTVAGTDVTTTGDFFQTTSDNSTFVTTDNNETFFGTTNTQSFFDPAGNSNTTSNFFNTTTNNQFFASNLDVIAIGNSNLFGSSGTGFLSLLGQPEGVTITNVGGSSLTTAQVLQGINNALTTYHPDVVVLMLGSADVAQGVSGQTEFNNLMQIVERIQATGAKVLIVGDYASTFNSTYENAYSQLATMTGAYYVPNGLSGIIGNSTYMADHPTHLNSQGAALLAQRIAPTFRTALHAAANGTGNNTENSLQVSCSANPASVGVSQSITWQATAIGGTNNSYTYSWSGTDGLRGTARQLVGNYASAGTKTATVVARSGNRTGTATCSVNVTATPQIGACFLSNGRLYPYHGSSSLRNFNF